MEFSFGMGGFVITKFRDMLCSLPDLDLKLQSRVFFDHFFNCWMQRIKGESGNMSGLTSLNSQSFILNNRQA